MSTDSGGYTFLKVDNGATTRTANAEAYCAAVGMPFFIPRTAAHLASAYDVTVDTTFGPTAQWEYLSAFGIYPDHMGAACIRQAFNSGNTSCDWSARDGAQFWVSNSTTFYDPSGVGAVDASMLYYFDKGSSTVSLYRDLPTVASSTSCVTRPTTSATR